MKNFFAPEETGKRLQSIAKIIAVITIVTAVLGGILVVVEWAMNHDSSYYNAATAWSSLGVLIGALAAEIFSCLLLHGFGVLVDNSYQQKLQAERQTALLNQLVNAQKTSAAPAKPVPVVKAAPVAQPVPAAKRTVEKSEPVAEEAPKTVKAAAPMAVQPVVPVDTTADEAVNILGGLLSIDGEEDRRKYLQDKIDTAKSEQLRAVCRKAMGMSDEQIIELIGTVK